MIFQHLLRLRPNLIDDLAYEISNFTQTAVYGQALAVNINYSVNWKCWTSAAQCVTQNL